jgi:mannose-6-phosphate isomerase
MALTLDDADEMIKTCDEHNARLFVVKQNRFNVPVLKLREAMEAIDFELYDNYKTPYASKLNATREIVNTPFFTTNVIEINKGIKKDYSELDSFVILLAIEGKFAYVDTEGHRGSIRAGQSLLIPAIIDEISIYPESHCKILEVYIIITE